MMLFKNKKNNTLDNENDNDHKKYKHEIREMEEHYDYHFNQNLPQFLHRADIFLNDRMLGYIDAMMATCATFLVIPLRNLRELQPGQPLSEFAYEQRTQFIMFFIGFLVVLTLWESINIRSLAIRHMDDFLVILMTILLLAATGLPFSLALQGHYSNEKTPIIITCTLLALFEVVQLIMVIYAIATPRVLHLAMQKWSASDRKRFLVFPVVKNMVNILIIVIGGVLCLTNYSASWVFMAFIILTPLIRKAIVYVRRKFMKTNTQMDRCKFFHIYVKGNISKDRVEAMSDAAIAIIACILILDITVEEFPKLKDVTKNGLDYQLDHMKMEFFAFLLTYLTVSLLWYINHSTLHLFRSVNVVILFCQKVFLAFVCLTPLVGNMIIKYESSATRDTNFSICAGSLNVFFSSMANFTMLLYGFYQRDKYLHSWAHGSCMKFNMPQHLYIITKSLIMPLWSLICAIGTIGSPNTARYCLFVCMGAMVVSFIVLKLVFNNHARRESLIIKSISVNQESRSAETKIILDNNCNEKDKEKEQIISTSIDDENGENDNSFQETDALEKDVFELNNIDTNQS